MRDPGGFVVDLTASPDGAFLAVSRPEENAGLLLLDAATLEPLPFNDDIPASGIAFSPDSSLLAMAVNHWTGNQGTQPRIDAQPVRLYDMPQRHPRRQAARWAPRRGARSSTASTSAPTADGWSRPWTTTTRPRAGSTLRPRQRYGTLDDPSRPVFRVKVPEYPILKLSPDGKRLYVVVKGVNQERQIRVYDVDAGRLIDSTRVGLARSSR